LGLNERIAGRLRQCQRLHTRGLVADAAIADAVLILGDALHDRRRPRLFLHGVLVVAVAQRVFLEEAVGPGGGVAAVETDRLRGPGGAQREVAPGGDVLRPAAGAALGVYRVGLP